jgi:lipopolysaccharide/colanic/teichoic acid biosynthesis glycosyltransferase
MMDSNRLPDLTSDTYWFQNGRPMSEAITVQAGHTYFRIKRAMDLVLSFALLLLLSPLLLVIAVLIKLDSRGPVIFTQKRMGYHWPTQEVRPFIFCKFRSMYHNCDQRVHIEHIRDWIQGQKRAQQSGDHIELIKLTDDERVTRVGRILRKTSLDELPQLWNVLKGEMSLVGPRPVPLYEVAEYQPWHMRRLKATPGITGLWQIKGRGEMSIDEMVCLDLEYINKQSLWLDLKILFLTIPAVMSGHGAA